MTHLLLERWPWILGGAILLLGAATGWGVWVFRPVRTAQAMTRPRRKPDAGEKTAAKARELKARGFNLVSLELLSAHARPEEREVILRGWFVRAPKTGRTDIESHDGPVADKSDAASPPSDRCVLLCHGLGPTRLALDGWMNLVLDAGWNAALFDLRAHGVSGGDYCTFGFIEARELADQVRHLRNTYQQKRMVLLGYSMGGSISILSLDHLDPGEIDGVIAVGAYDDFLTQSEEYLISRTRGLSTARWRRRVIAEGERTFGAPASTLSPAAVPPRLPTPPPALIVHGKKDTLVPYYHAARLAGCFNGRARLLSVEDAGHFDVLEKGGQPLRTAIRQFLDSL